MYDIKYVWEKMEQADREFAHSSDIKKRIYEAYNRYHHLRDDDFPTDDMKAIKKEINEKLTKDKSRSGHYIPDTIAQMTDDEAEEIAGLIHDLAMHVAEYRMK